jgi:hypothetical protein
MTTLLRAVAWLEVLCGAFMVITVIAAIASSGSVALNLRTGMLVSLGSLGIICGVGLLRSSLNAWRGSLILQLLMTPVFQLGSANYRPGLGLFFPLGFNLGQSDAASTINEFSFGVDFAMSLNVFGGQPYTAVNVAALSCLAVLLVKRPRTPLSPVAV